MEETPLPSKGNPWNNTRTFQPKIKIKRHFNAMLLVQTPDIIPKTLKRKLNLPSLLLLINWEPKSHHRYINLNQCHHNQTKTQQHIAKPTTYKPYANIKFPPNISNPTATKKKSPQNHQKNQTSAKNKTKLKASRCNAATTNPKFQKP